MNPERLQNEDYMQKLAKRAIIMETEEKANVKRGQFEQKEIQLVSTNQQHNINVRDAVKKRMIEKENNVSETLKHLSQH